MSTLQKYLFQCSFFGLLATISLAVSAEGINQPAVALSGSTGLTCDVQYSPDGSMVAAVSTDGVRIWNARGGDALHVFEGDTSIEPNVTFSHDGALLATDNLDGASPVWDTATGALRYTIGDGGSYHSVVFSPTDDEFVTTGDAHLQFWDAETGDLLRTGALTSGIRAPVYAQDGSRLLVFDHGDSVSGQVRTYDVETGMPDGGFVYDLPREPALLRFNWASEAGIILIALAGGEVLVFDDETSELLYTIQVSEENGTSALAVSDDASLMVVCPLLEELQLWDLEAREFLCYLVDDQTGEGGETSAVDFAPDGRSVVAGFTYLFGQWGDVEIWDLSPALNGGIGSEGEGEGEGEGSGNGGSPSAGCPSPSKATQARLEGHLGEFLLSGSVLMTLAGFSRARRSAGNQSPMEAE